jgi:2-hydroxychromene-2-carboxylate isomerase
MSSVHLSPTRSSARASGDHWLYGWRLGGGTVGMLFEGIAAVFLSRTLVVYRRTGRLCCGSDTLLDAKLQRRLPQVWCRPCVVERVGTVTSLEAHRLARRSGTSRRGARLPRATLFFDLASPFTYLAAERADRLFAGLEWQPAYAAVLHGCEVTDEVMHRALERAGLLGLPLVWPEDRPPRVRRAMRVASLATECGRGAAFVLAASRLAFCGGYDVDEPEILLEAAAAAGMGLRETLAAAGDLAREELIADAGRLLLAAGATALPALRVGGLLFCGEDKLVEAAAARAAG